MSSSIELLTLIMRDTIEIRIFRSNIKQISFFKYLEFVHSVNHGLDHHIKIMVKILLWTDYFDWLLKIHKDYLKTFFLFR